MHVNTDTHQTIRDNTFHETLSILNDKKKAAVIRPTGFGKTGILTRIIASNAYKSILYLYPAEVVRDTVLAFYYGRHNIPEDRMIPNVDFMTYTKLVYMKKEDMEDLPDYKLCICDECHRLGAGETMRAMDMLLETKPGMRILGATATPDRMDLVDEIGRYFEDHVTSEYTLHNAFQDKFLQKPYYVFCNYADVSENIRYIREQTKSAIDLVDNSEDKLKLMEDLDQRIIEISNLYRMDKTIRDVCDQHAEQTDYMRFIVFFHDYETLHSQGEQVKEWFHTAYPSHRIQVTEVTSETDETKSNVNALQTMAWRQGTIDLIFCCNMLTMGYHVPGLTGIIMMRGTRSNICYIQMLGRALSSGESRPGIVFDVVDNIHVQSLYMMLGEESKFTKAARNRLKELTDRKEMFERYEQYKQTPNEAKSAVFRPSELSLFATFDANPDKQPSWNKQDEQELAALTARFANSEGGIRRQNTLEPKDLIVIHKQAGYRDLIAKTVAEAKSMRCRQAWTRWIEQGGEPYDEEGRIRTRKQILDLLPPEHHPLPPYCRLKQVSVNAVLDEMQIKDE